MNIKLQSARLQSGKTQAQVARESSVSVLTYQRYEYGERTPGVRTAIRIAKAVNSTAEILWGEGAATPENPISTE